MRIEIMPVSANGRTASIGLAGLSVFPRMGHTECDGLADVGKHPVGHRRRAIRIALDIAAGVSGPYALARQSHRTPRANVAQAVADQHGTADIDVEISNCPA